MSILEDEDLLDDERYADDPKPVRERMPLHRYQRRNTDGGPFQWAPVIVAVAVGFLIATFGPCRSTDREREKQLSSLQGELQSAQDRAAQLEAELSAAREGGSPAEAPEPASEPQAKAEPPAATAPEPKAAPAPKPERRSELTPEEVLHKESSAKAEAAEPTEPPAANSATAAVIPEPSPEPERIALAESESSFSVYQVPDPSAESVRSSTRPEKAGVAWLQVLAPEQAGWTAEAQPTIYWHASEGTQLPGEFTLTREGAEEPVFRGRFPAPDPGIQRIELSEFGVTLDEGASYRWKVSFVDPEGSEAGAAVGGIRRVSAAEASRLTGAASVPERLDALERAGLWYDALDLVVRSIENNSGAKDLVTRRAAMLAKVGIHLPSS